MKEIYKEYKEIFKGFLKNKTYMVSVILIALLCYGFTITNSSVGLDDLLQDRYTTGTYLLSQGRWGNVILSLLFGSIDFAPFWTDFIATVLFVALAILLCTFIKKEAGEYVNKNIFYIIFSGMLLSYPLIHHIFIYHFANVITAISTIAIIIIAIIIYENSFNIKRKRIYFLLALILPFFISMYESCAQTYAVFILAIMFIRLVKDKKITKQTVKFFVLSIVIMLAGIILNELINQVIFAVLENMGKLTRDYSAKKIYWFKVDFSKNVERLNKNVFEALLVDSLNVGYIGMFFILAGITLVFATIHMIKKNKISYVIIPFLLICVNFTISILQTYLYYRVNNSWQLTVAFMALYMCVCLKDKKIFNNITTFVFCFIILHFSRTLTTSFYNDYLRYEREKAIAYDIANSIVRECRETDKPLVYVLYDVGRIQGNAINYDNGRSLFEWGIRAFEGIGIEATKFINSLGYNFKTSTIEETKLALREYYKNSSEHEGKLIVELEDYIIVRVPYERTWQREKL